MKVAGVEIGGARVLVVGMARSGIAAARLLRARGSSVTATDARPLDQLQGVSAELAAIGAVFTRQTPDAARGHDLVVISPGVPIDAEPLENARRMGIPVIGEIELASFFLRGPVCAITGSNGKTTTTSLVGHILRESGIAAQVGGNIGTAPAAMVDSSRDGQWNVLEVSSFQLEAISNFRARIAVCLNLTEDHLDRHRSMAVYEAAKGRLFETQHENGFAVLNADDAACVRYAGLTKARPLWFSLANPVTPGIWLQFHEILFDGESLMDSREIPLRGLHNVQNVLAAAAAARLAGASLPQIASAVRSFPGVEHRLEFVRKLGGVEYFNDSKATNVDATLKAIDAFPGGLWIILGGKDKGSDYAPLREPLRSKAKAALLVGAAAGKIARAIEGSVTVVELGTIAQALDHAWRHAQPGDVVLLAPACASFDQFDNFEHRGKVFKQLVAELAGE